MDFPLEPSEEMLLDFLVFEQRPDAPHRALVPELDRRLDEFRRERIILLQPLGGSSRRLEEGYQTATNRRRRRPATGPSKHR